MKRLVGILFVASAMASVAAEIRSVEEGCADCTAAFQKRLDGGLDFFDNDGKSA